MKASIEINGQTILASDILKRYGFRSDGDGHTICLLTKKLIELESDSQMLEEKENYKRALEMACASDNLIDRGNGHCLETFELPHYWYEQARKERAQKHE